MAKTTTATASAKTAPARSAAPGTTDKKAGKKAKVEKKPYLAEDADKLESKPDDFDPKIHRPLKKTDFVDDAAFLIFKADEMEAKAKSLRAEAEMIRSMGSKADQKKVKRLQKLQDTVAQLQAQLAEDGIDVNALMEAAQAAAEGKAS